MQCGGAIYTDNNSTLTFNGTTNFTNNGHNGGQTAYGGGVYMGLNSSFYILPNSTVYWEKNHANYGGAIYVDDAIPLSYCTSVATYVTKEKCFFQLKNLFRFDAIIKFTALVLPHMYRKKNASFNSRIYSVLMSNLFSRTIQQLLLELYYTVV